MRGEMVSPSAAPHWLMDAEGTGERYVHYCQRNPGVTGGRGEIKDGPGVWGYRRTWFCIFRTDPHIQLIRGGIANPKAKLLGNLIQ